MSNNKDFKIGEHVECLFRQPGEHWRPGIIGAYFTGKYWIKMTDKNSSVFRSPKEIRRIKP